jgi:hypothetical protein
MEEYKGLLSMERQDEEDFSQSNCPEAHNIRSKLLSLHNFGKNTYLLCIHLVVSVLVMRVYLGHPVDKAMVEDSIYSI